MTRSLPLLRSSGLERAFVPIRARLLDRLFFRPAAWVAWVVVSPHSDSEAGKARPVRGRKWRLSVPSPDAWEYDDGRPTWIGTSGNWVVVANHGRLRFELPQAWPSAPGRRPTRGRPPLEAQEPQKLLYAAWLKECWDETYLEVARALRFPRGRRLSATEQGAKKQAIRYVKRGRALACRLGIWPWTCWPNGIPPRGAWWLDDRCSQWLLHWHLEAMKEAVLRPAIETQLLVRTALERQHLAAYELSEGLRKRLIEGVIY